MAGPEAAGNVFLISDRRISSPAWTTLRGDLCSKQVDNFALRWVGAMHTVSHERRISQMLASISTIPCWQRLPTSPPELGQLVKCNIHIFMKCIEILTSDDNTNTIVALTTQNNTENEG